MKPHEERVLAEKAELDGKSARLEAFLSGSKSSGLPADERDRMARQLDFMRQYSGVLRERIANFFIDP